MTPFVALDAVAAYLPVANVDTDAMIPSRFLRTVTRKGLGRALFAAMREDPSFVLNRDPWTRAGILIAHHNFGCGSSREHAPWGLVDFGIRCVIAPSFADIFYGNCLKNGILPIRLPLPAVERLGTMARCAETAVMSVDLPAQVIVAADRSRETFAIASEQKARLIEGTDDIARTATRLAAIEEHERRIARDAGWRPVIGRARLDTIVTY